MTAELEIICVGNELLIGKVQNTNAGWLAKQATLLGANVKRVTVVQDLVEDMASCIKEALARKPAFIITTGGLGPTFDDKTLQGVAKALGRELEVNPKALEMVKQRIVEYTRRTPATEPLEMTPPRVKMATFPQGTEPVLNPVGTAPGLRVDLEATVLFALPGVPHEMEAIFNQTIAPLLKEAVCGEVFWERSVFVDDIFESHLAPLIDKVMTENEGVYIKSHPIHLENQPHLEIHLTMTTSPEQKPEKKLLKAARELAALIKKDGGTAQVQNLP